MQLIESILEKATIAVPAVKYAVGVSGVVASIALIKSLGMDHRVSVFGVVIMMVLMVALFVFSKLTKVSNKHILYPALLMLWAFVGITILTATFLFTSVFFNYPVSLQHVFDSEQSLGSLISTTPETGKYNCRTSESKLNNCRIELGSSMRIYFESPALNDGKFSHQGALECVNDICSSELYTMRCLGCDISYNKDMTRDGLITINRSNVSDKTIWEGTWSKYGLSTLIYLVKE